MLLHPDPPDGRELLRTAVLHLLAEGDLIIERTIRRGLVFTSTTTRLRFGRSGGKQAPHLEIVTARSQGALRLETGFGILPSDGDHRRQAWTETLDQLSTVDWVTIVDAFDGFADAFDAGDSGGGDGGDGGGGGE